MKKYDCSKVLDFKHEKGRMCEMTDGCDNCCLGHVQKLREALCELRCDWISAITENEIAALQKWSDEHPEKTRAEAFLERVPTYIRLSVTLSDGRKIDRPYFPCWGATIGRHDCCYKGSCNDCWGEPYNGEYEKEEK